MILIFSIILCVVSRRFVYTSQMPPAEKALIFNQQTERLVELSAIYDDKEYRQCLVACPAASQLEVKFNEEVSIAKKSIFMKNFQDEWDEDHEYAKNIKLHGCKEPFTPSIVRDEKTNTFEIGYELYYEDGKTKLKCEKFNDFLSIYNYLTKQQPENYYSFAVKYLSEKNTKFIIDEGPVLAFYWISVLSFRFDPKNFQISVKFKNDVKNDDPIIEQCDDYDLGRKLFRASKDVNFFYSKPTGALEMFQEIVIPPLPKSVGTQGAGSLQRMHIMPMMFAHTNAARLATCTYLNTVPVWSEIADGQLKLVDQYLYSIFQLWNPNVNIIFGVSGIRTPKIIKPQSKKKSKNGILNLNIFPIRKKPKTENIPVPKLIYRIVEYHMPTKNYPYYIAILIHNDPAAVPHKERLCSTPTSGWEAILNDNPSTGLSYACALSQHLNAILGAYDQDEFFSMGYRGVLQLNTMPPIGKIKDFVDVTENIDGMMKTLFPNEQVPRNTVVN